MDENTKEIMKRNHLLRNPSHPHIGTKERKKRVLTVLVVLTLLIILTQTFHKTTSNKPSIQAPGQNYGYSVTEKGSPA